MMYIGVDYSTRKLAMARFNGAEVRVLHREFPANKYKDRVTVLSEIHYTFADWLGDIEHIEQVCIAIEAPIMGRAKDVQTAIWMGMTAGGLAIAATDFGYHPMLVPPSVWKKSVLGNGRADKSMVEVLLEESYPEFASACGNDDERDAMCLALYARSIDKEYEDDEQEAAKAAIGQQR